MTNVIYHATLVRTVRSFPKHHSLAGGTGRARVSFSALGSPCSLQQGAGKKRGQQQWQFIHNILECLGKKTYSKLQRSITLRSYRALCKAERGGHEMGLPTPPASPVTVTLLSQLLNYDCAHISLNRSTLTYSQLCCCFCKVLPQHQTTLTISLLACYHIHTPLKLFSLPLA